MPPTRSGQEDNGLSLAGAIGKTSDTDEGNKYSKAITNWLYWRTRQDSNLWPLPSEGKRIDSITYHNIA